MLWVEAFHIIFMVTWFAGLFYLPRLFVYHAMAEDNLSKERFKIMERKLYYGIMSPGAILTGLSGLWLISYNYSYYRRADWLHTKLILVALLAVFHLYCGKLYYNFKHDRNPYSHKFYRWINEVPVLFLVSIILLVVVKPF